MSAQIDAQHECPLCGRRVSRTSAHHLTPKSRGGRVTLEICTDCHAMIHALFPNKQLERQLSTVEELKSHSEFAKYLRWIANKPTDGRFKATKSRKSRKRGRSG